MGPGDIKQKIDERGAKSNPPPPRARAPGRFSAPPGRGWGREAEGSPSLVAREPRARASSRVQIPAGRPRAAGGIASLARVPIPRGPQALRRSLPRSPAGGGGASTSLPPAQRPRAPALPLLPTSRGSAFHPRIPHPARGAPRPHRARNRGEDLVHPAPTPSEWGKEGK